MVNEETPMQYVHLDEDFAANAACKGFPTEWWFPTKGMNVLQTPTLKEAKEICGTCAVRKQCLDYGVATRSWGVWGGFTLNDGRLTTRDRKKFADAA